MRSRHPASPLRPGARASRIRCARPPRHGERAVLCAPSRRRSRCCSTSCCGSTRAPARRRAHRHDRHRRAVRGDDADLARLRAALRRRDRGLRREQPRRAMERPRALLLGRRRWRRSSARWRCRGAGSPGIRREQGPTRAGDRADRARRACAGCGSTTRSRTGPTRTCGGASTSASSPTTRCTTAATSRSAARRARSPAAAARAAGRAPTRPSAGSMSTIAAPRGRPRSLAREARHVPCVLHQQLRGRRRLALRRHGLSLRWP